jgi:hypothetical protein
MAMDASFVTRAASAAIVISLASCGGTSGLTIADPVADVSEVVCHPDAVELDPTRIRAQGDGIHLQVSNPSDEERMLILEDWGYEPIPPGDTELILTAPPGEWRMTCVAPVPSDDPETEMAWPHPAEDDWATFPLLTAVDVDGVWADSQLPCPHPTGWHNDYEWDMTDAPVPAGRKGDPVDLAREDLPGELGEEGELGPGDVVDVAGYRDREGAVRLIRDGEPIAIVTYRSDGQGGWHFGSIDFCEDDEVGGDEREPADGDQDVDGEVDDG